MKKFGKFKTIGREEKVFSSAPNQGSSEKIKVIPPRIDIDSKAFPYLHDKSIGEECVVLAKIKKVSESIPAKWENDQENKISIEILAMAEEKEGDEYEEIIEGEMKRKE